MYEASNKAIVERTNEEVRAAIDDADELRRLTAAIRWLELHEWEWSISRYVAHNGARGCHATVWDRRRSDKRGRRRPSSNTEFCATPARSLLAALANAGVDLGDELAAAMERG